MLSPDQAALRDRLGAGARYDTAGAPHDDLLLARRGTAYVARLLERMSDADVAANGRVLAHLGYHARAMAEMVAGGDWVDPAPRVDRGATLPPRALRSLVHHAAVHLNVEWRDLNDAGWDRAGIRATPRDRARVLWAAAMELGGARRDLPPGLEDV